MTELRTYEDELRADLRSAAASVQPPDGLAERLVAGTSPSGRATARRRTRPRWVDRWALPALAAGTVVAVVATTVVVHAHVRTPSTTPAAPVGVVPWKSLPRPGTSTAVLPPPRVTAPAGTRECVAADFVGDSARSDPDALGTGWVLTSIVLRSTASSGCTVSAYGLATSLVDATGAALPNDSSCCSHGPYRGPDPLVRPGQLLATSVSWAVYQGRAPRPTKLLLLPTGGASRPESTLSISLVGFTPPPRPSNAETGQWRAGIGFVLTRSVSDPGSLGSLDAVARVPKEVRIGQVLTYQVELFNHTNFPVHLDPCPEFTQDLGTITFAAIKTFHEASFRGLLNCEAAPKEIAPRSSVSFAIQLGTGGSVAGNGQLTWELLSGGYEVATIFTHVQVVP